MQRGRLLADVGQRPISGHDEGDAVSEGYLPVKGVAPITGEQGIALVQEGEDGADYQGGVEGTPQQWSVAQRAPDTFGDVCFLPDAG